MRCKGLDCFSDNPVQALPVLDSAVSIGIEEEHLKSLQQGCGRAEDVGMRST